MTDMEFIKKAKQMVIDYVDAPDVTKEHDVKLTWYCYLAGNRKALFDAGVDYLEVTYIYLEDKMIIDGYKWTGKAEE